MMLAIMNFFKGLGVERVEMIVQEHLQTEAINKALAEDLEG